MKKLLTKLIKKWWKPFGWKDIKKVTNEWWFVCFVHKSTGQPWLSEVSYRELVSIESGLWQFCVENDLVKKNKFTWMVSPDPFWEDQYDCTDYRHRIIESALRDERELEQFLLENILIK